MSTVYLDRDNKIRLKLEADGSVVGEDRVTRAQFWFPAGATDDDNEKLLDTQSDSEITLTNNATVVEVSAGQLGLKNGRYQCYLTIFDVSNPNGLAWDKVVVRVTQWQPDI